MRIRPLPWLAALLLWAAFAASPGIVMGDVTVERITRSGGLQGIGASESWVIEKYAGLKKREIRRIKPTGPLGKVVGKLAGEILTDEITDIPGGTVRKLDHEEKSYAESRIALPKAKEELSRDGKDRKEKPKVRVVRNEIRVRGTGERKPINGFDCRRHIVTWLIEIERAGTKERSKTTMTNDLWTTPETKETRALEKEGRAFLKAYLKKAGSDLSDGEAEAIGLAALSGMFGEDEKAVRGKIGELRREMSEIRGYPIVSTIRWESETTRSARPGAGEAVEKAKPPETSGGVEDFVGGMAQKAIEKKIEESGPDDGKRRTVLFASHSEIRRIDLSPVSPSEFAVPAGYEPVK